MGDSKRWTVTYTKHIKQKRKVYQDGFLELKTSTNNVALYDECNKLLECRLLSKDDIVASGETLMFNGYLVDIIDPKGDNKPHSDLNVDTKHKNSSKFRTPSTEDTKINVKENIARARKPLSPSQKIIKEFKKRELLKYGSPKISPETTKSNTTEWQVLYTTQGTQKAKKYHDGFLRLVICGSLGGQVMLFDASRKLLDSRFLKKDDVIRPGESIAFDAYLVDIGEHQGNYKPDFSVQGDNCTNFDRMEKMDRQQNSLGTHAIVGKREWQVLYTTQLTQKAKKYHDGFLLLEFCGSRGRQVVLRDFSKRPLERRFLKKDEVIKPGESLYFDGHLVDIGEPEGSHQSHSPLKLNEQGIGDKVVEKRQHSCLKANPSVAKGQPPSKQPPSKPRFGKDESSNSLFTGLEVIKSDKIVPPIKPLRDVNQILSILQNAVAQESYVTGSRSTITSAPSQGSCQNIMARESAETMKSPNITSSKGYAPACDGGSFQFTENVKTSHQPYSNKEAQTNISEADFGFSTSSGHSSSLIANEGESAEEFSCKRETCPSFDLGF